MGESKGGSVMESCSQLYTRKIIDSIIHGLEQQHSSILFVKHYNTLNVPVYDISEAVKESKKDIELLYHEFSSNTIQEAYEPFFGWIKQLYFKFYYNVPIDEFLEKCDVYYLSRSTIKTYITTGLCQREENIIVVEVDYERKQFEDALVKILSYISQEHTLFLVLNKLHLAENSTLNFLLNFIKNTYNNISLLANYNEAYVVPAYMIDVWRFLMHQIEDNNLLLDWNMQDSQAQMNIVESFEPVVADFQQYLVKINNMLYTLATKQAMYYLDILYNKVLSEKSKINDKYKIEYFIIYAIAAIYENNITVSLMMCEKLKSINNKHPNVKYSFIYYYLMTMCQIYGGQSNLAKKNNDKCFDIAVKTGSNEYLFYSQMLYYMRIMDGWTNAYCWDRCDVSDTIEAFYKVSMERKMYNHLAHTMIFDCCNKRENYINEDENGENQQIFNKAMEIANDLKNKRLIIAAWRKNVFMAQGYGYFSRVDYYYKKCLEIVHEQNDKKEEAGIYNGLGFNRIVSEQFVQANEYFNKALLLFYNLKDTYYVAETLYNMATNAILAEKYSEAYDYLTTCLKLLDSIKYNKMKICNISKVYGMIVYCSYKMGIEYNAHFYLNKMERVLYHIIHPDGEPSYFLWDDDMFFYYFTSGLLAKSDSLQQAQEYFDKARYHMFRSEGLLFFVYAIFASEQADLYDAQGMHDKAEEILNSCIEFCNKKGYKHKEEVLFAKQHNQPLISKHISLSITSITKYQIDELIKISEMETMLDDKTKGINFLVVWQEMLNKDNVTVDDLIENSMVTIQNNYNVDGIVYVEIEDEKPVMKYNRSGIEFTDEQLENITNYLDKHRKEFVASRFDKEFYEYTPITSVFGINKIISFACVPLSSGENLSSFMLADIELHSNMTNNISFLDRNDLTIFKFALRQMNDTLYKLKARNEIDEMNEKLRKRAVTDLLTGLLNRQGFAKKIDDYTKLVESERAENIPATVLYIDLDNFKFCNDTFGHHVGDAILIAFSRLFENVVTEKGYDKGYIVRYGGDEFLIILPGCDSDMGVGIAKDIYSGIEKNNSFIDVIEKTVRQKTEIPSNHRVSCSIGIASMPVYDQDNMNIALKHADSMLYDVKKHDKSDYRVWKNA